MIGTGLVAALHPHIAAWRRRAAMRRAAAVTLYILLGGALAAIPLVVDGCRARVVGAQIVEGRLHVFRVRAGVVSDEVQP